MELDEVEIILGFDKVTGEDCKNCDESLHHEEQITEVIKLKGKLTHEEQQKLFKISNACPIRKMIENGINIDTRLIEAQ